MSYLLREPERILQGVVGLQEVDCVYVCEGCTHGPLTLKILLIDRRAPGINYTPNLSPDQHVFFIFQQGYSNQYRPRLVQNNRR